MSRKGKRTKTTRTARGRRKKGRTERFRLADVQAALELTGGLFARAAETLGCAPTTVANYVARYPTLRRSLDEIVHRTLDLAEDAVLAGIRDPMHKGHVPFTLAYLRAKGAARGWGTRADVGEALAMAALPRIAAYLPKEVPESEAPMQRVNADGTANEGDEPAEPEIEQSTAEPVDEPPEPPAEDLNVPADGSRERDDDAPPHSRFAPEPRRRRWRRGADGVERLEPAPD